MISDAFNERHNLVRTASVAFLWNHGLFVVNSVIAGLTTYVLARFLKPQDFGIYTSTMAFASLAALLISFGYEGALNVYFPRMRDCTPKLRYLFRQMLWRRFLIVVALFCVLGTYVYFNGGIWLPESLKPISRYLHLAFACGFLTLISGLLTRALITLFRVKPLAVIRVSILSCSLAVYSFLLIQGFGITAILCATIAASGATILLYIVICRDLLIGRAKKVDTNEVYSFGRTTWITDLLGYLLGKNIDIIVMTLYGVSLVHVGFYHIAFSLVAYARMIVNKGMTGVLQSAFSSAYHKGGLESLKKWWEITMKFQIMACAPGVLFLVLYSHKIFESILPNYTGATIFLRMAAAFALIVTVLGGGTHITAFYAIGKEKIVLWTRVASGLLNLLLDIVLIYFFGVLGAIIATGISGLILGFIELYIVSIQIDARYPIRFLLKCSLCLVFAALFASPVSGSGIIRLIFCGLLYAVGYCVCAWIIRPLDNGDITRLNAVNPRLGRLLSPFCTKARLDSLERV